MSAAAESIPRTDVSRKKIKCVVWDLDNTVWKGVLLEDKKVELFEQVADVIKNLDNRGILQSIASRNDQSKAFAQLKEFGLDDYFIYPQINWNSKSTSIENIAKLINIGIDTLAFVDDQAFEREEVGSFNSEILCIDTVDIGSILNMPEMNPLFITDESKIRRRMYQSDIVRNAIEERYEGPKEAFLAGLDMVFNIAPASREDLKRAEELTVRTNQLNTTGYTYSFDELDGFRKSNNHRLYVTSLVDKYGTYGKIGLALIETTEKLWTIKLLLMSCRVMSRGVGSILINHIRRESKERSVRLQAEFVSSDVNRMMYMTYKFAGFTEHSKIGDVVILANDLSEIPPDPDYVEVIART